jgi:hypothetical protein
LARSALSLRFSQFILAALIATLLSGCWEGTTRGVQATVLAVDGPAMMTHSRARSRLVVSGMHPGVGDVLETTGPARAAVALLPNLLIQLDRGARLEIIRLAITKDGNETGAAMQGRTAEVRLGKGRMFASQLWGEARAKFSVMTSHGELVTTSNALFCLEAGEQRTRLTCVSGSVAFRTPGSDADTPVPPGFVGEWNGSGATLVTAETDARGQEDSQEGLEVEETLRALSAQNRFKMPR